MTDLPKTAAQDMSTDPAVVEWHKTLSEAVRVHEQSTSARLAEADRVLADLCVERDEARAERDELRKDLHSLSECAAVTERERGELAARVDQLEEHERIRAQVIRERNDERRAVWQALGIDMLIPVPDAAETIRGLIAERDQFRSNYLRDAARVDQLDSDLVDMELDRDEARAEAAEMRAQRLVAAEQVEVLRQELAAAMRDLSRRDADATARQVELKSAYQQLADVVAERDQLSRDLAGAVIARHEAERELASTRSWQVAGQDAGVCFRCDQPIVRGQAVEPQPGTTKGSFAHVHCQTEES